MSGLNYTRSMQGQAPASRGVAGMRIDRWLFAVRLYKSRAQAVEAVSGGKVHVNGTRVKPARALHIGDRITLTRGAVDFECEVVGLPLRRGPAREVAACYSESLASSARRNEFAARMRVAAALAPRPDSRPEKHARRALRRMRGRG